MVDIGAELARHPQSINALKVIQRLNRHGFQAYLVGGCVRDLMLGQTPKDFDVTTDAHPSEIRSLFSHARSIGRRFKIVHIRYGRDIIEVATFRAAPSATRQSKSRADTRMILSDNIYGTFEDDVMRRDFTMNALYYNPEEKQLNDLVAGVKDIKAGQIRLLGKPENRFREDPVRMLRAVRFKAKLNFSIDVETAQHIKQLGYLLQDIPSARLSEEVMKLFLLGHGFASFIALKEFELLGWLFPAISHLQAELLVDTLISLALKSTDERIANKQPVTPAFIYAALLWWPFLRERDELQQAGALPLEATLEATDKVITQQQRCTSVPKRFAEQIRDIWQLQTRLTNIRGQKPQRLMQHRRFRAAYDFLMLREMSGENLNGLSAWWTDYQKQHPEQRQQIKKPHKPRQRGPRWRR